MIREMSTLKKALRRPISIALLAGFVAVSAAAPTRAEQPVPAVPDNYQLSLLIFSTLTALDQANSTGNYSVLRELAAPDFQRLNPAQKLAGIFSKYRDRHVVLAPVILYQPRLIEEPQLGPEGILHLKGFFPTRPLRIGFDLSYQLVDGSWRLMALSISPSEG